MLSVHLLFEVCAQGFDRKESGAETLIPTTTSAFETAADGFVNRGGVKIYHQYMRVEKTTAWSQTENKYNGRTLLSVLLSDQHEGGKVIEV